jgi:hypothetical protein
VLPGRRRQIVELIRLPSRGDDSISALECGLGDLPPKPIELPVMNQISCMLIVPYDPSGIPVRVKRAREPNRTGIRVARGTPDVLVWDRSL